MLSSGSSQKGEFLERTKAAREERQVREGDQRRDRIRGRVGSRVLRSRGGMGKSRRRNRSTRTTNTG